MTGIVGMRKGVRKTTCAKCDGPNDRPAQRYCKACHAAHMRATRKPYQALSPEAKQKAAVRSLTKMRVSRGAVVKPAVCEQCSAETKIEAHHLDYAAPNAVAWLCRPCHLKEHKRTA